MLTTAEAGSAWTIVYPSYSVVVPRDTVVSRPLGIAVPLGDARLIELLDRWIEMTRGGLDYDRVYNHWILGKDPKSEKRRWSIVRDVLHWVQ